MAISDIIEIIEIIEIIDIIGHFYVNLIYEWVSD